MKKEGLEPVRETYFVSSVASGKKEETRKESNPLSSRAAIRFPFFRSFLRILPKKRLTKGRHARIFCNAPRKKREKHSWAFSSAGRAPPWHGGGHRFDPDKVHQLKIDRAIARFFHIFLRLSLQEQGKDQNEEPNAEKAGRYVHDGRGPRDIDGASDERPDHVADRNHALSESHHRPAVAVV